MQFVTREFSFPKPLSQALQSALPDIQSFHSQLKRLWPSLAKGRGQDSERHYSFDADLARAYAAYYLPANLMKLPLILEEMRLFGLQLPERGLRWLDGGSGPGTALWGLAWWAAHRGRGDFEFWGLEQSLHFVKLASALGRECLASHEALAGARVHWEAFRHSGGGGNSGERLRQGSKSFVQWIRSAKPHVVSLMNSIGEMAPTQGERDQWLAGIVEELSSQAVADRSPRWLILIEPGTQAASRELLASRDVLRERSDVRVWLPCLSARSCGALAKPGDWCHEEAACVFPKWHESIGASAGLRKEALLFSCLVVSVGVHPGPANWPATGARVVSQRMKEKGLTQCFLCTESGKVRARVLDSRQAPSTSGFVETVRGDVYDRLELSEKGDVLGLTRHELPGEMDVTVFPRPE